MAKKSPVEVLAPILDSGRGINTAELAEEMIAAFGGARKFSQSYYTEFEGCKVGGIARTKMLDGVLRVVTAAGSQNKGRNMGDPSNMSDEDLMAELGRLLVERGVIRGKADAEGECEESTAS